MKPLNLQEKAHLQSLVRIERRAIVPIKWFVLIVVVGLYSSPLMNRPQEISELPVLLLFSLYMTFTLIETSYLYFGAVGVKEIKRVALVSYIIDLFFVSVLILFDTATIYLSDSPNPDFYILFFLLAMRGFALFKSTFETIIINTLISILFILILWLQERTFEFITDPQFVAQIVLVWLVILMAWFIMVVLNQQRLDLMRTAEQLVRADSLARIGELAAGVAHEINNPLGIIIATTDYMKKTTDSSHPLYEDLEAISSESKRCKETVERMLLYAKPKPEDISWIDAAHINDDVMSFVFPKGRTGKIEVVKDYAETLFSLRADPNMIKQALLNLYLNAKQAIPEGNEGRIVSRIYNRQRRKRIVFEIEDNGSGVDPETLIHIFDPFYTTKPGGSGLGLSVTQRIVEAFGGDISFSEVSPHGTIFRLEFPGSHI